MEPTPHQRFMKEAAARRRQILKLTQKGVSQAEIARRVGVTRERIRQIVKAENARIAEAKP
jgi:transcriptional regulator